MEESYKILFSIRSFYTHESLSNPTFRPIKSMCSATIPLKVPKREIFDRSDFPDFYTIKSRREGDFGVKIKKF